MTQTAELNRAFQDISTGDRIRFTAPDTETHRSRWWTVAARDERYIIASRQAPFHSAGLHEYTVIDLVERQHPYNDVPPGIVRSSLNTLGGGFDTAQEGWADTMLAELNDGTWELSNRRLAAVHGIEVES